MSVVSLLLQWILVLVRSLVQVFVSNRLWLWVRVGCESILHSSSISNECGVRVLLPAWFYA